MVAACGSCNRRKGGRTPEQAGLALGAWGAVQASAAGIAVALGGIIRDVAAS